MDGWLNEWSAMVQIKCKIKFVLTLKQARGFWGCLGNWLPVRWMGKWVWSQQGFVGRWERRQAIGTQRMPHRGLLLMIWQRCWPWSICWEIRRVTTLWHVGNTHTPWLGAGPRQEADSSLWKHHNQGTPGGGGSVLSSHCWFLDYSLCWVLCRGSCAK